MRGFLLIVLSPLLACGANTVEEHRVLKETLDGCGYSSCGWHHPFVSDGSALACALQRARDGEAAHLEVSFAGDGASCGNVFDVYLGSDGAAQVLLRTPLSCDEELSLERCTVRDVATLQTCIDEIGDFDGTVGGAVPCGNMSDWLQGCESVEAGICS